MRDARPNYKSLVNQNLVSFNSSKSLEEEINEGISKIKEKFNKVEFEKNSSLETDRTISPLKL